MSVRQRGWGRRGKPTGLGELLDAARGPAQAVWSRIVGSTLAREAALVGVGAAGGRLRVTAVNDTVRREIEARADFLLAAWNDVAAERGLSRASGIACRVDERVFSGMEPEIQPPAQKPPLEDRWVDAAEADIRPMQDPEVRRAVVEARARSLRAAVTPARDEDGASC